MPRLRSYGELLHRHLSLTVIIGLTVVNHRSLSNILLIQYPLRHRMHPRGKVPDGFVLRLTYFDPCLMPVCLFDMSPPIEADFWVLMMTRLRRVNRYRRLVLVGGK